MEQTHGKTKCQRGKVYLKILVFGITTQNAEVFRIHKSRLWSVRSAIGGFLCALKNVSSAFNLFV